VQANEFCGSPLKKQTSTSIPPLKPPEGQQQALGDILDVNPQEWEYENGRTHEVSQKLLGRSL
jgi:hypothetical protein